MNKVFFKKKKETKKINCLNKQYGFTLVEMLVYLGIMTVITITLVQSFIVVLKSNRVSFADSVLRNSGYSVMENITREIRSSKDINTCGSGILQLVKSDNSIVNFSVNSDGLLLLSEGNPTLVDKGFLNSKETKIFKMSCIQINNFISKALKIELNLGTEIGGQMKKESFYSTIILRSSY